MRSQGLPVRPPPINILHRQGPKATLQAAKLSPGCQRAHVCQQPADVYVVDVVVGVVHLQPLKHPACGAGSRS